MKGLGDRAPWYPPTPASRATAAPGAPSRRATGATSTRHAGAASTSVPAGHAACPWGPCRPGDGEVMCPRPRELLPHSPATLCTPEGQRQPRRAPPHAGVQPSSPSARLAKGPDPSLRDTCPRGRPLPIPRSAPLPGSGPHADPHRRG